MDSFDLMPLACIVNGKFLALHGGISPDLKSVISLGLIFIQNILQNSIYKRGKKINISVFGQLNCIFDKISL